MITRVLFCFRLCVFFCSIAAGCWLLLFSLGSQLVVVPQTAYILSPLEALLLGQMAL